MGARVARLRTGRRSGHIGAPLLTVLVVFAVSMLTISDGHLSFDMYRLDLDVYRMGAHAWLHGRQLYGPLPPTRNGLDLGFTYPPISAIVMTPLAVIPSRLAAIVMTAITLGLLVAVVALFLRVASLTDRIRGRRFAALLLPLAVLVEPVRTTLAYGQINVVLMALIAFDCLLPSTWWTVNGPARKLGWPRGALVGLAAALKLTPAVFILYFIARRDWRAAATTVASFAVVTGIGFLLAPHDSVQYWTSTVFNTGRIGPLAFSGNQSLNGVINREHLTGSAAQLTWLGASAVVGVLALVAVTRESRAGRPLVALTLTACTALLVSPVSWSHHWVWAAPALLAAAVAGWRTRQADWRLLAVSCAGIALFISSPPVWFPHTEGRELRWGLWEQVLGSAYVWVGLGALCVFALRRRPEPPQSAPRPQPVLETASRS
jgi:alpha-1,2-mannosyltransferase